MDYHFEHTEFSDKLPAKFYIHTARNFTQVPMHWHSHLEINLVLSGTCHMYTQGSYKDIQGGELCIINSEDIHGGTLERENNLMMVTLLISYDFLKQICQDNYDNLVFIPDHGVHIEAVKNAMMEIYMISCSGNNTSNDEACWSENDGYSENNVYSFLSVHALLYQILYHLFTGCAHNRQMYPAMISSKYLERFKEISQYMAAHYTESITLSGLAKQFFISPEHLSRCFKRYMGMTFKDYLDSIRITHACTEVIHSDLSMMDIALKNGYSDTEPFYRAFKKYYHTTPAAYRKLHGEKYN